MKERTPWSVEHSKRLQEEVFTYLCSIPHTLATADYIVQTQKFLNPNDNLPDLVRITILEKDEEEHTPGWQPESYFLSKKGIVGHSITFPYRLHLPFEQDPHLFDQMSEQEKTRLKAKEALTVARFIKASGGHLDHFDDM